MSTVPQTHSQLLPHILFPREGTANVISYVLYVQNYKKTTNLLKRRESLHESGISFPYLQYTLSMSIGKEHLPYCHSKAHHIHSIHHPTPTLCGCWRFSSLLVEFTQLQQLGVAQELKLLRGNVLTFDLIRFRRADL